MSYRDELHGAQMQIEELKQELEDKELALSKYSEERVLVPSATSTSSSFWGIGGSIEQATQIKLSDEMEILYELDRAFGGSMFGAGRGTPTRIGSALRVEYPGLIPTTVNVDLRSGQTDMVAQRSTTKAAILAYTPWGILTGVFITALIHGLITVPLAAAEFWLMFSIVTALSVGALGLTRLGVGAVRKHLERKLKRSAFELSRKKPKQLPEQAGDDPRN